VHAQETSQPSATAALVRGNEKGPRLSSPTRIPLIDFRIRPPFASFVPGFFVFGYPLDESLGLPAIVRLCFQDPVPSRDEKSFDLFLKEMDEAGVVFAVVKGRAGVENADVAKLVADHPDRFAGFGGVHTSDIPATLRAIAGFRDLGFVGASNRQRHGEAATSQ
jgi:hypothetical protein